MEYVIPTKEYADLVLEYNETRDFSRNVQLLNAFVELYFNNPEKYREALKRVKNKEATIISELLFNYKALIEEREKSRKLHDSLYELIKQKSKEKDRPLKIIAD